MGYPWARLDANIAHHDKICWLKAQRGGWRAISVYLFSIGWSVGQGTDGHIPAHMARSLDADRQTTALLTAANLWEQHPAGNGWLIRNFAERQEVSLIREGKEKMRQVSSMKANCTRWHGPDCGCWKTSSDLIPTT